MITIEHLDAACVLAEQAKTGPVKLSCMVITDGEAKQHYRSFNPMVWDNGKECCVHGFAHLLAYGRPTPKEPDLLMYYAHLNEPTRCGLVSLMTSGTDNLVIFARLLSGKIKIGYGTFVGRHVSIGNGTWIGNKCTLDKSSFISSKVTVNDHVRIKAKARVNRHSIIRERTTIGKSVLVCENVSIGEGVTIGKDSVIGKGSMLLAGAKIGKRVSVGENVVVNSGCSVPDDTVIEAGTTVRSDKDSVTQSPPAPAIVPGLVAGRQVPPEPKTAVSGGRSYRPNATKNTPPTGRPPSDPPWHGLEKLKMPTGEAVCTDTQHMPVFMTDAVVDSLPPAEEPKPKPKTVVIQPPTSVPWHGGTITGRAQPATKPEPKPERTVREATFTATLSTATDKKPEPRIVIFTMRRTPAGCTVIKEVVGLRRTNTRFRNGRRSGVTSARKWIKEDVAAYKEFCDIEGLPMPEFVIEDEA